MKLWLTGGHQARPAGAADRDHGPLYDAGVLAWLDPDTGAKGVVLRHRSPPEVCGGDPGAVGHTFKAGSLSDDGLWLCTEREVLRVDPEAGAVLETVSHPWLNDVHHVRPIDGVLHVVCSGLDGVLELGVEPPRFHALHPEARPPSGDVRSVDLEPHRVHPNHIVACAGRRWVTAGVTGALVALEGGSVPVADVVVHDGVLWRSGVLMTSVDGRLWHVDPAAGKARLVVDLRPGPDAEPLGWCRGLAVVGDLAWVGFTRIRATRLRENLAWVRGRLRGRPVATRRPTRVVAVSLATGRVQGEWPLAEVGLDALFSILPAAQET